MVSKNMKPGISGDYPRGTVNQGGPQGTSEDRIVSRAPQSVLGNAKARDVGSQTLMGESVRGGPGAGRDVYDRGTQGQTGASAPGIERPSPGRSPDVMSRGRR